MTPIQERVSRAQREVFLRRVCEVANADPAVPVPGGGLGQELGLPYERALRIIGELQERGLVRRSVELSPPEGPLVRITPRGVAEVFEAAAA